MAEQNDLTDHFLIAMPALADPNFAQTVAYICEHHSDGALGIVVNRPSELTLAELFTHMGLGEVNQTIGKRPVYVGGPVQPKNGFVLHSPEGDWDSSLAVSDEITITTSRDILEALAHDEGPRRYLVALGYAGWGTGQLEYEMSQNAWLSSPADPAIIFDREGHERWHAAAQLLGVDLSLLSSDSGHA